VLAGDLQRGLLELGQSRCSAPELRRPPEVRRDGSGAMFEDLLIKGRREIVERPGLGRSSQSKKDATKKRAP